MTYLKDLIEREIERYIEWPTDDKSIVTTVSAKLFAEHVARLYADHIPDAGKMIEPAGKGEAVGEVRLELGAQPYVFAELYSESPSVLAPGTKLYAAPQHVEPELALGMIEACANDVMITDSAAECAEKVYLAMRAVAPQPAEQPPSAVVVTDSYALNLLERLGRKLDECFGYGDEEIEDILDEWRDFTADPTAHHKGAQPDVTQLVDERDALQNECALLCAAIRRLCNIYVVDDYYMGQLREERLESAVNRAIDAAMQGGQP